MGEAFSKQISNFVFLFYPKAWTMPHMAIRHLHGEFPRRSYSLDANMRCTKDDRQKMDKVRNKQCEAVCSEELKHRAIHEMLGFGIDGYVPSYFTEKVTFKTDVKKSKKWKQLSKEWHIRAYNNMYTEKEMRYVFYHDCLKKAAENTFYKGLYMHLLPYLDRPWACQVCGTPIPNGVKMAVKLQKANIHV